MTTTSTIRKMDLFKHKKGVPEYDYLSKDYLCFGDYDGMKCSAPLNVKDIKFENKLYPKAHVQSFYLFRPKGSETDDSLWVPGDRVMTVSFVKLKNPKGYKNDLLVKFEKYAKSDIVAYRSIGGLSDIVFCVRKDKYADCVDIVHKTFHDYELANLITYSYSVFMVPTGPLKKPDFIKSCNIYKEELYRVSFAMTIRTHIPIEENPIFEELNKSLNGAHLKEPSKYSSKNRSASYVLGDYDVRQVFEKIKLHDLLKLYLKDAPLHYESEIYKKSMHYCVTRILTNVKTKSCEKVDCNEIIINEDYDIEINNVENMIKNVDDGMLKKKYRQKDASILCTMQSVLYALRQAAISRLGRDTSDYLFPKVKLFIELFNKYVEEPNGDRKLEYEDYHLINVFLMRIYIIISTSNIGSLDLFQSQSIEMKLFNAPLCIMKYYNDFANELSNMLCDIDKNNKKYEFLFLTDVASHIETHALFDSAKGYKEGSNIIMVSISENDLFSTSLLPIIAHEVAHDAGDKLRCRKLRGEQLIDISVKLFCESILKYIISPGSNFGDYLITNLENVLNEMVKIVRTDIDLQLSLDIEVNTYGSNISKLLLNAFYKFLYSIKYEILVNYITSVIWKNILDKKKNENAQNDWSAFKKLQELNQYLKSINVFYIPKGYEPYDHVNKKNDWLFPIEYLIFNFIKMCQEIQADLISLMTLKPEPDVYIKQFINSSMINYDSPIFQTRVKIVLHVLASDKDKEFNCKLKHMSKNFNIATHPFEFPEFFKYENKSCADEFKIWLQKIICGIKNINYEDLNKSKPSKEMQGGSYKWLVNNPIYQATLFDYAFNCAKMFKTSVLINTELSEKLQSVRSYYDKVTKAQNVIEAIFDSSIKECCTSK